ncbi:integral membrane protein [Trichoderma gamsii]|uniref:Integral membrane protein n=1 Tax=Trichoderma gamsii TaxID=398673 RepID=A0A2P4ZU00_9HYPO|nr:integral membrane protein [Trichoderma gamsii]PON27761.1 integral membrane protein [Trichoderma gamsii]
MSPSQTSSTIELETAPSHTPAMMELSEPTRLTETSASISKSRAVAIIVCITCISGISNLLAGLLTVCIPVISADLGFPPELQLWPASAFALACGCTLLLCAAAADILGCRRFCLVGALLQTLSALGAGLAKTPSQLIALRAMAGIAASFCLPSAVGIAARAFPAGTSPRSRSAAFSAMGGGQAVGFGLGLVLGGVFSDTLGWRWAFYTTAILNVVVLILALWALPSDIDGTILGRETLNRLARDIDWLGCLLISAALALLSYELAVVSGLDAGRLMHEPANLTVLCISFALLPLFWLWMRHQTRHSRPALIPNAIWKNLPFTTVCVTVFLVWGALNASEQLAALYLQEVRNISPLTASLYFLPAPVAGAMMNIAIGVSLPYLRPSLAVPIGCLVSGIAPLLLATLCRLDGPNYWHAVFQAMALNPLGADLIYTIANLVVTSAFPAKTQALAGGVFQMLSQIGKSIGIASTSIIAQQVAASSQSSNANEALLQGYKAGWWYNSGLRFVAALLSFWGLRNVGKLGVKID